MRRGALRLAGAGLALAASLAAAPVIGADEVGYAVTIEPGITPRLRPDQVVERLPPEHRDRVSSLECLSRETFRARARSLVPAFDSERVWLVRVEVPLFRPRLGGAAISSPSQVHLIDDVTGASLGRGTGF
jgi:hypothetical protein